MDELKYIAKRINRWDQLCYWLRPFAIGLAVLVLIVHVVYPLPREVEVFLGCLTLILLGLGEITRWLFKKKVARLSAEYYAKTNKI